MNTMLGERDHKVGGSRDRKKENIKLHHNDQVLIL